MVPAGACHAGHGPVGATLHRLGGLGSVCRPRSAVRRARPPISGPVSVAQPDVIDLARGDEERARLALQRGSVGIAPGCDLDLQSCSLSLYNRALDDGGL